VTDRAGAAIVKRFAAARCDYRLSVLHPFDADRRADQNGSYKETVVINFPSMSMPLPGAATESFTYPIETII
jgi:hypothetical protein